VGVVVAQVLATCTNQSSRRALVIEYYYACCSAHNITLRTWSFVLKQRGLGHEGGERHMYEDQLGPMRSGEDGGVFGRKRITVRPGDPTFTVM